MTGVLNKVERKMLAGTDQVRDLYFRVRQQAVSGDYSARAGVGKAAAAPSDLTIPADKGFLRLEPGRLPGADQVVPLAQKRVAEELERGMTWPAKAKLRTDLLNTKELDLNSPYMQLALDPGLLGAVSRYLGVAPVIAVVDVWYSRPLATGPADSELYHCDWADRSQVKLFLYCSDVDLASGPLTVLDAERSATVRKKLNYTYGGKRYRVRDEEVDEICGPNAGIPMQGNAGTALLVDTSRCFHFGSRVQPDAKPRTLVMVQYLTPTSFALPWKFREKLPFKHLDSPSLTQLQRLALGRE